MFKAVKIAVLLAAAVAAVGGPTAAAQAKALPVVPAVAGFQIVENAVSLPAGGFVRQVATCPAGKVVFGGGAAVVGAGSANFGTEVQESSPGTVNGGASYVWLAAVSNHSSTNYTLGIFAVCGTAPSAYKIVQNSVSLPAGGFVRQVATCPAGTVVFGGGAAVVGAGSANFGTEVQESSPGTVNGGANSVWLAAVSNHSSTNYTLGVFAVCGSAPTGYQVVEKAVSLPAGGFVRQVATCPSGDVVLGGGTAVVGDGSANFGTEVQETSPGTVNGGASYVWLVAVGNHSSASYTLGIFAVCAAA